MHLTLAHVALLPPRLLADGPRTNDLVMVGSCRARRESGSACILPGFPNRKIELQNQVIAELESYPWGLAVNQGKSWPGRCPSAPG
jgi:hypothetical protein